MPSTLRPSQRRQRSQQQIPQNISCDAKDATISNDYDIDDDDDATLNTIKQHLTQQTESMYLKE